MAASVRYFVDSPDRPVSPDDAVWSVPLPVSRTAHADAVDGACTYGDYFDGVSRFLEGPGRDAIERVSARGPHELRVFLVKHGEHYHPARVEAEGSGALSQWVLNVAVSDRTRALLRREHAVLLKLAGRPKAFLPEVYAWGEVECRPGVRMGMMLGEWFAGYHEFHLTRRSDGALGMVVWAPGGTRPLSDDQAAAVYRQAAYILTSYLDLEHFQAIGDWHHAAGDFVVCDQPGVDLRLVTARDYRLMFNEPPADVAGLLHACLLFLLRLTIRNRLDRLDGTGEMAWAGPQAVAPTVDGALRALADLPFPGELPMPFDQVFARFLARCSRGLVGELSADLVARDYPPGSAEREPAEAGLDDHVRRVAEAFARL